MRPSGIPELGTQPRKQRVLLIDLGRHQPEEGVMLHARLPQLLGRPVVGQLEADGGFELLELARTYFDVEIVPLVADLQDLGPGEAVYSQPVAVHQQAGRAHAQHDVDPFRILCGMQIDPVHG